MEEENCLGTFDLFSFMGGKPFLVFHSRYTEMVGGEGGGLLANQDPFLSPLLNVPLFHCAQRIDWFVNKGDVNRCWKLRLSRG